MAGWFEWSGRHWVKCLGRQVYRRVSAALQIQCLADRVATAVISQQSLCFRVPDAGVFNVGPVVAALRIVTLQGFGLLGRGAVALCIYGPKGLNNSPRSLPADTSPTQAACSEHQLHGAETAGTQSADIDSQKRKTRFSGLVVPMAANLGSDTKVSSFATSLASLRLSPRFHEFVNLSLRAPGKHLQIIRWASSLQKWKRVRCKGTAPSFGVNTAASRSSRLTAARHTGR